MAKFQELLLILMHLMGKQLIQNPKILSIRHSSLGKEEKRNVFIENRIVVTVMQYHKGYILNENIKIIHWYLLQEVRKLVVYYLWLVLLMVKNWEKKKKKEKKDMQDCGWCGQQKIKKKKSGIQDRWIKQWKNE